MEPLTVYRITQALVVIPTNDALVNACHGSPKTQDIKDAIAHAESGKPLARFATQQMPTVREQPAFARRLSIVWLLPWPPGVDARKQMIVAVAF
jgi:hypothetical protein